MNRFKLLDYEIPLAGLAENAVEDTANVQIDLYSLFLFVVMPSRSQLLAFALTTVRFG